MDGKYEVLLLFLGCGGLFEFIIGDSKIIKSPNYGKNYPADSDCRWMLLRDNGTELEIIINEMYLETCSTCSSCDYIKIYKGLTTLKTLKHTICQNLHTPYIINGNLVLHFHSDSRTENRGFAINVTAFRGNPTFLLLLSSSSSTITTIVVIIKNYIHIIIVIMAILGIIINHPDKQ